VPEPDISSLSDSTSEGFDSSSEELESTPLSEAIGLPGWQKFTSGIMQLETHSNARQESQGRLCTALLARVQLSFTVSITTKTILKADQTATGILGGECHA
jgi:hypothetical protein